MKIYSKFKDYYDNVLPYSPEDRLFIRDRHATNLTFRQSKDRSCNNGISQMSEKLLVNAFDDLPQIGGARFHHTDMDFHSDTVLLGLCGKLYPLFVLNYMDENMRVYRPFFKPEEFKTNYFNRIGGCSFNSWEYKKFTNDYIDSWYHSYHINGAYKNIFIEFQSPVFLVKWDVALHDITDRANLIINPKLGDIGLQRLFDPFTLYQNIDMYLNNDMVMVDSCDIKRSNELIRDSKGMDKWSFKQIGPKARKIRS